VPLSIAELPDFQFAFQLYKVCPGRVVRTLDELEAVRFCTIINGSLVIEINDATADFNLFSDIEEIRGIPMFAFDSFSTSSKALLSSATAA
jgi:hypothetical protein